MDKRRSVVNQLLKELKQQEQKQTHETFCYMYVCKTEVRHGHLTCMYVRRPSCLKCIRLLVIRSVGVFIYTHTQTIFFNNHTV